MKSLLLVSAIFVLSKYFWCFVLFLLNPCILSFTSSCMAKHFRMEYKQCCTSMRDLINDALLMTERREKAQRPGFKPTNDRLLFSILSFDWDVFFFQELLHQQRSMNASAQANAETASLCQAVSPLMSTTAMTSASMSQIAISTPFCPSSVTVNCSSTAPTLTPLFARTAWLPPRTANWKSRSVGFKANALVGLPLSFVRHKGTNLSYSYCLLQIQML